MTVGDCVELIGLEGKTYDTALPQTWVDQTAQRTGVSGWNIWCSFVWLYEENGGHTGRPCALTVRGNRILARLNAEHGTDWPQTENAYDSTNAERQQWAKDAIQVQNACNLSGVLLSFSQLVAWLREVNPDMGSDEIRTHPLVVLFASKVDSLTGYGQLFSEAYGQAHDWAGEEEDA